MPRHVMVLGDQLTRRVGPLHWADPSDVAVLMVESDALARSRPHHRQKLALVFAAMRHFAAELERDGFTVAYHRAAPDFAEAVTEHLAAHPGATLEVMRPNDRGVAEPIAAAAARAGGRLELVANRLWLVDDAEWDAWDTRRARLRMEGFYRRVRAARGWLMDPDDPSTPLGGRWNLDAENRRTPDAGTRFTPPPRFEPDAVTRQAIADVLERYPEHPGSLADFAWPVTRAQALAALDAFVRERLARFGPFEDAMLQDERVLDHSQLSVPLNLGLLHPREVVEAALAAFEAGRSGAGPEVPLASIEGFVRQVLGWREFMFHVYRTRGDALASANALGHRVPLPRAYWDGETRMACFATSWRELHAHGWNHHIQRLMVFGNLALGLGVDPVELTDWFSAMYVDALDWVMVPNVMAMSQYADGGGITTKPYLSGGAYIDRMSDYCRRCPFDPRQRSGEDACPFTALYWDFVERHAERFERHPRMAVIVRSWRQRDAGDRAATLATAGRYRERLP
jgi:deoxyribodipyrimidine photolyase-related protein